MVSLPEAAGTAPVRRIGRFTVLGLVGRGGLGEVYAAHDGELDRRVALKMLPGEPDPAGVARLRREALTMARLSHPNVARVYDVGTHGAQVFVAMEFVRGQTLRAWLAARPRTWKDIRAVFVAAGQGLAAAHREGVVHRDFKPDNVVIADDGRPRVVDFGLATPGVDDPTAAVETTDDGDATQPSDALAGGTPAYMAPEQHLGRPCDARADQFSFCVAMHEALYGRRPFVGRTWHTLRPQVLGPANPKAPAGRVPAHVRVALQRGLRADPAQRFPDMDALLAALTRDPPSSAPRRLVLAAAVLTALGVAALTLRRPAPSTPSVCTGARDLDELSRCALLHWPAGHDRGDARLHVLRAELDAVERLARRGQHAGALARARVLAEATARELGPDHPLTDDAARLLARLSGRDP
jgi:serine/threonine protein kinase